MMNQCASIPKRIIQTGKTCKLSTIEQAAVAGIKCLNPEFEWVYFDDAAVDAFMATEPKEHRDIFAQFPYRIQRYDFFRYLAVYRLGGFYFDLDVFLAKGIADLSSHSCVFPFEELTLNLFLRERYGMDWDIGNYAFGASAAHPFLAAIIANCVRAQQEPSWVAPMMTGIPRLFRASFNVLHTTGPGIITRTLADNPALAQSVHVLFPDDVCDERTWHQFGEYGAHLMAGSWRPNGSYLKRRLALLWEARLRRRLLELSRGLGKGRSYQLISNTRS